MSRPLKGFITYAHKNTTAKDELIMRLDVMQQQNKLVTWHDAEMIGGGKWREEIFKHLADSDILLYLVSAASLASKNCNKELAEAVGSDIRIIPIILEHCDWQNHQLSDFQALPDKGKPINKWQPESDGWQNVVAGIREAIEEMQASVPKETLTEWVFQQGNFLIMLRQIDKAIEAYSHALKLNPNNAATYNNHGAAYYIKDNYARGIEDYTKAIELKPDFALAYNNRGAAYGMRNDYDHAIADFSKAIELNPDDAIAYTNRGLAYSAEGNVDDAIADYTKAMKLNPNYANAYINRGVAYYFKGDYARAVADYNMAIERKPDDAIAYTNRGLAYSARGDVDRAIADYTEAIKSNPNYADAYTKRGAAYGVKGEIDRALVDLNKAIELNPDDATTYINRGAAYGVKGEIDRALVDFSKVIDLKPDDATAYTNRGAAYGVEGEVDRALVDFSKAIELNPNYATTYYNRGRVWLHLREWERAKSDLTSARDKGMDIIASFHNDCKSVEAYEQRHRVKLPADIALMLTQRRRDRFPATEKFLSSDGTPLESSDMLKLTSQRWSGLPKTEKFLSSDAPLESPDVLNLLAKLRNAGTPLSQYVQARPTFGLRTGGSGAFVVDSAIRDQLIAEHPSSADILKPFLRGRDIRRWQVARPDSWLIFTYRRIEINRYPAIQKHLEKYRSALRKRAGKQKWYELPATKSDAEHFTQTKLICPNRYDHQTIAVDTEGFYCGDTCYLIPTEETWLCGLLNSRAVEWFYWQTSDQSTGDYLRTLSRYMQQISIPDLSSAQKLLIGKLVDYLIFLQGQPTTSSGDLAHARDFIMLKYFERIIDGLVYECYLGEELHQGEKQFFKPLLDERLPHLEEIRGNKMAALQEIFERLYERTHPIRRNLFFLDSVKPIRIIEGKA